MAPAVQEHPGARPTGIGGSVDYFSVRLSSEQHLFGEEDERFVLAACLPDGTRVEHSRHRDFRTGWECGQHQVTARDLDGAYELHELVPSGHRLRARFAHSRILKAVSRTG